MEIPKAKNPYLNGNFAPIKEELSYKLNTPAPTDITGIYMRNGPNHKLITESNRQHLFDGDGMIHGIKMKNGQMWYSNTYCKTSRLDQETKTGKAKVFRVGETYSRTGIFKVVVSIAKTIAGGDFDKLRYGVANTALVEHNKKLYALEETCLPFQIQVKDDDNGGFSLDSLEYSDFDGKLTHAMTAHPKVD